MEAIRHETGRPRVYAIYGMSAALKPYGGDYISELETLRWMSLECDVYYNGVLFDPATDHAGLEGGGVVHPDRRYDLVYVRDNLPILRMAKEQGLRTLYFGKIDDPEVFKHADMIAAHNPIESVLIERNAAGARTFLAEQPGRGGFAPMQDAAKSEELRMRWGGGFTLGFFGRIDEASFPNTFYGARDLLAHYIPDLNVVFAGKVRWKFALPHDLIHEQKYFSPGAMPYVLSACAATIGIEQPEAEHAGSNRTIECIRCGVPIITRPYAARREQLGDGYPLYFSTVSELVDKLVALRYDKGFQGSVRGYMESLWPRFRYEEIQSRNSRRLMAWLSQQA